MLILVAPQETCFSKLVTHWVPSSSAQFCSQVTMEQLSHRLAALSISLLGD